MTQRDQSNSAKVKFTVQLNGAAGARLRELAAEQGVRPVTLAREILEEILPKVESAQRRVSIKLRGSP